MKYKVEMEVALKAENVDNAIDEITGMLDVDCNILNIKEVRNMNEEQPKKKRQVNVPNYFGMKTEGKPRSIALSKPKSLGFGGRGLNRTDECRHPEIKKRRTEDDEE